MQKFAVFFPLRENVLTVAPMEAEAIRADSLAKEDAVIGNLNWTFLY